MVYKVEYYATVDASRGRGTHPADRHFFTDAAIEDIPAILDKHLQSAGFVGVIQSIESVGGYFLPKPESLNP